MASILVLENQTVPKITISFHGHSYFKINKRTLILIKKNNIYIFSFHFKIVKLYTFENKIHILLNLGTRKLIICMLLTMKETYKNNFSSNVYY